ncbi:ABC transporter permease [Natranaerobius thermophilus]|uniref:Binding-protein-dependent transport systems inner membrane component n=1 Tax=Natranaerobius thermophilus (strain ATCC BAA-1301 / DSM 18059 / JW/NM-WN-LF) TaxID=457570 RepID=B2A8G7_NATTJ|nr:ABC transporter permease [Natranaerobius thermophilus]ACB85851.1 binding-protein-dependent transport systems inner membrane component [Natranaerobius thermophilus JW/NM-WN-LF]
MDGFLEAFQLVLSLDSDLWEIIILSLQVSGIAIGLATLIGVPLGTFLGLYIKGRLSYISVIIYTLMGTPPVVVGLFIFLVFTRGGPLGHLELLFTPTVMIIAQTILSLPLITALTLLGVQERGKQLREVAITLGAGPLKTAWTVVIESRNAILGAILAGFGRVISEVGAVMLVGGNIEGQTRVMTTAILLEVRRGNTALALGLGFILLFLAFLFNFILYFLQGESRYGR